MKELSILEKLNIITKLKHPIYPIFLYNYTERCKKNQFWNDTTFWCRGLVLDVNGIVIARPFKKFFEESQLYNEFKGIKDTCKIYDKIDGALGIMFFYNNRLIFCNRQSFKSRQAIVAKEIFYEKYINCLDSIIKKNTTYLFEIVYPESRFVVNYGSERDLFLLGIVSNDTGKILKQKTIFNTADLKEDYDHLNKKNEGVVVHYENGFKVKFKTDYYKKRYNEIAAIKQSIADSSGFLYNINAKRNNWNVDYTILYKTFHKRYLQIYLKILVEDELSELDIIKKIALAKVFGG